MGIQQLVSSFAATSDGRIRFNTFQHTEMLNHTLQRLQLKILTFRNFGWAFVQLACLAVSVTLAANWVGWLGFMAWGAGWAC